jgi:alkanesulfonate monooxygenase SsuD/methylene tetrahydromethanopterin reductase-like flavin-dependent oxidoreductase (luciferase family)
MTTSSQLRHGLFLPPFDELADPRVLADTARLVEDRGWDGLFLWDHVMRPEVRPVADPWIALAAIATVTERIRIGPMITPVVRRRPQVLARQTVSLDVLSRGRLVLGMGLGVDSGRELSAFGEVVDVRDRARILDEGAQLLCDLWSGEEVDHRGPHFRAESVTFLPRPVQRPRIPIWFAARSPAHAPLRRAARYDGLFPIEVGPDEIVDMLAFVAAERGGLDGFDVATTDAGGRDPAPFRAAGVTWWMTGIDPPATTEDVVAMAEAGPPRA